MFTDCFNCLPIAAVINNRIFCIHGGLSPELTSLEQIKSIQRPTEVPEYGLLTDLLWSDPDPSIIRWAHNCRGTSFRFGSAIVKEFLDKYNFDLICRGHEMVHNGFQFLFGNI